MKIEMRIRVTGPTECVGGDALGVISVGICSCWRVCVVGGGVKWVKTEVVELFLPSSVAQVGLSDIVDFFDLE